MQPHLLINSEIQKYYENGTKFNGVYSRNSLPKIKDGAFVTNLDKYESVQTHWITFYVNDSNVTYFDSFGVEHILKEIKKILGNKNNVTNICRIQAYDLIIFGYCCVGSIDVMLKGKSL